MTCDAGRHIALSHQPRDLVSTTEDSHRETGAAPESGHVIAQMCPGDVDTRLSEHSQRVFTQAFTIGQYDGTSRIELSLRHGLLH